MWVRVVLILCGMWLVGCSFGRPADVQSTALPITATVPTITETVEPTVTTIPTLTVTPAPVDTTIRVRIVAADRNSYAPVIDIIERAAQTIDLDVAVDIRSPDGTLVLQQGYLANDRIDVWIASAADTWQLGRVGAISSAPITTDVPSYSFVAQLNRDMVVGGIAPIAAHNYFISIYNTEILSSVPTTTNQVQSMPGLLLRPRYRMAFPWAEGRWFDAMMQAVQATSVISDGVQSIDADAATSAMQTLVDLRTLGPRDATSYIESTTDFLNSRVPYTIDGDAALRRYAVLSDTLLLDYALPPVLSVSDTLWLPPIDMVYAVLPANIDGDRRAQVLLLIQQLQRRDAQNYLYEEMRWIPIRNDVLSAKSDDRLAAVLDQVGQLADAQVYDDATICRWDSYEQVLPFALLKIWRIPVAVEALQKQVETCPASSALP